MGVVVRKISPTLHVLQKWPKGEIGTIAVLSQQTWFVNGPNGVHGLSVLVNVGPKVQKLEDVDSNKLEVTVELEDVLVKLNKVSNPDQGLLHVQVGQISTLIFRLVSLWTNEFIWDFQKILCIIKIKVQ